MSAVRKLAGPFTPVEGVEWCTVHQAPAEDYDDDADLCEAQMVMGQADGRPCHLVTLYIEAQS